MNELTNNVTEEIVMCELKENEVEEVRGGIAWFSDEICQLAPDLCASPPPIEFCLADKCIIIYLD